MPGPRLSVRPAPAGIDNDGDAGNPLDVDRQQCAALRLPPVGLATSLIQMAAHG